jgi:rhamnulokinase
VAWHRLGKPYSWNELTALAERAKPLSALIDLDHSKFLAPNNMLETVLAFFKQTGQAIPSDDGVIARATLESLALRYRACLNWLEQLLGYRLETIHIVGGGVQNALLCQMTSDACQRVVVAGPVEATALGNIISQLVSQGKFTSIAEGRRWMRSMEGIVQYEPKESGDWDKAAQRLDNYASIAKDW